MASLESLRADQRAVLELVLRRGCTYDEIAGLLSIDRAGVRTRALEALDALGPQTGVAAERRGLITDYLLRALPPRIAQEVRDHLAQTPSERAWARVVAGELRGIASEPLPEIPGATGGASSEPAEVGQATDGSPAREPLVAAGSSGGSRPSSRRGGALLLGGAGAAAIIAVVLALVLSGGGSPRHHSGSTSRPTIPTKPTTTATTSTGAQVVAQINLNPPSGGKAKGIAEVLREQGKVGIAIVADGLVPNKRNPPNAYAVWLSNSPTDSLILGFVNPGVGTNGRLQTAGGLPANASHYHKLLVTLETKSKPKTPGPVVLEGTLMGL
jgi:hypothetical protein